MPRFLTTMKRWLSRSEREGSEVSRPWLRRFIARSAPSGELGPKEMRMLYNMALEIASQARDEEALLKIIIERAVELLNGFTGGIYLLDANGKYLTVVADWGVSKSIKGHQLKVGEGGAGRVAVDQKPLVIKDYSAWAGRSSKLESHHFKAVVEVPLVNKLPGSSKKSLLGVLFVTDLREGTFKKSDALILDLFASFAAITIKNAQNMAQLRLLHNVSAKIGSAINLQQILQITLAEAVNAVKTNEGSVMMIDPKTSELEIKAWLVGGEFVEAKEHRRFALNEGIAGHVAITREPYICNDSKTDPYFVKSPAGRNPRSILCVPIRSKNNLLCVLNADSTEPGFFSDSDIESLRRLADHVALAIESQRLRDLSFALTEIGLAELGQLVVENACALTTSEMSTLFVKREGGKRIDRAGMFPLADISDPVRRNGLTRKILHEGKHRCINNVQESAEVKRQLKDRGVQALMGAPLNLRIERDGKEIVETIGVLFVSTTAKREFTRRDIEIHQTLANQAAIAISNAQQDSYRQSLISGAIDAIIAIDRNGMIKECNPAATAVLGYAKADLLGCHISKILDHKGELRTLAKKLLQKGASGRLVNYYTSVPSKGGTSVSVRLSASLVENGIVGFFRDQNQIESLRQFNEQISGLLDSGKAIAGGESLEAVMEATVKKAREHLGADPVCLYYYKQDPDEIHPPVRHNLRERDAVSSDTSEGSLIRKIIREGTLFTDDVEDSLLHGEFSQREKIRAAAAVRLQRSKDGKTVGVLFLNYRDVHSFSEHEKIGIDIFANEVGNKIDSVKTYQDSSRKAELLHSLSRAVIGLTSNFDDPESLKNVLQRACEITHAEFAALGVATPEGKFEPFLAVGLDEETERKIGPPPGQHGLFGQLFHQSEGINLADVSAKRGDRSDVPAAHPKITSFLGLPIHFKGEPIGNIYVANKSDARHFDHEDEFGLKLFARLCGLYIKTNQPKEDFSDINLAYLVFCHLARNVKMVGQEISAEVANLRSKLLGTSYQKHVDALSKAVGTLNSYDRQIQLDNSERGNRLLNYSDLADRVCKDLGLAKNSDFEFFPSLAPLRFVEGNPFLLELALKIILENAVDAIKRKNWFGTLKIDIDTSGGIIQTRISDTGDGLAQAIQTDLFLRLVTTDAGIGLSSYLAAKIIRNHKGSVRIVQTIANEGTIIEFSLPESDGTQSSRS